MKPSEALQQHRQAIIDIVPRHHATNPRVFGSVLHGEDHEGSDLDLFAVDNDIVWNTTQNKPPDLHTKIKSLWQP